MPVPSPCIDKCRFNRKGHCLGCSMTRAQKRIFAGLKKADQRRDFLQMLREQQIRLGCCDDWPRAYLDKCRQSQSAGTAPPACGQDLRQA